MKKTYILDTNVFIQSPIALYSFEDNDLVIPLVVVEELDKLKKAEGEKGANARAAVRILEKCRTRGNLLDFVELEQGGTVRIESNYTEVELPKEFAQDLADNRILKVCKGIQDSVQDQELIILVTKDLLLRIKAQIIGIKAQDFTTEQITQEDAEYTGRCQVFIPDDKMKEFKKKGIDCTSVYVTDQTGIHQPIHLYENEFVIVQSDIEPKKTMLGRVRGTSIIPLEYRKSRPYGVVPKNVGQYFMQEALMASAEEAPLVIIKGMAGTAKTFYSLAVGMEKVYNNPGNEYRKILICRPNAQFDDDIGFLPGSEQDKIAPLMRPIIDNLEQILDSDEKERYKDEGALADKVMELFERGIIQTEALNFIRGRSIAKTYLVIDEAQNMTPNQIKGIITRAGKDTKIILLGDPKQIDKAFLDERTNGLSYAAKYMKGSPYCWQITLSAEECERSLLAMDAIKRL